MSALRSQLNWETQARNAKEILNDILRSRRQSAELGEKFDLS
jgi:hypothetical protein